MFLVISLVLHNEQNVEGLNRDELKQLKDKAFALQLAQISGLGLAFVVEVLSLMVFVVSNSFIAVCYFWIKIRVCLERRKRRTMIAKVGHKKEQ